MAKEPGPGEQQVVPGADTQASSAAPSPQSEPASSAPQSAPSGAEQASLPGIAPPRTAATWSPTALSHEPPEEAPPPEPVFTPFSLTVGDGFKFGCGLSMALTIAALIFLLALSVLFLLASLVGAPLPIGR
jgi:hypothetical protein